MKKYIITITIALVAMFSASAQEKSGSRVLPCGTNVMDVTLGLGDFTDILVPPVGGSYERVLFDYGQSLSFGVAGYGHFEAHRSAGTPIYGGSIQLAGLAHLSITENLEVYAGPSIGYIKVSGGWLSRSGTSFGAILGARYFFKDRMGANVHFGGITFVSVGVSFKL